MQPVNFVRSVDRGFGLEAAYRIPMQTFMESSDGDLTLRFLATRLLDSSLDAPGLGGEADGEGAWGASHHRGEDVGCLGKLDR